MKEIIHYELVQEPMFVIDCWREVFYESKARIPEKELDDIYAELYTHGEEKFTAFVRESKERKLRGCSKTPSLVFEGCR